MLMTSRCSPCQRTVEPRKVTLVAVRTPAWRHRLRGNGNFGNGGRTGILRMVLLSPHALHSTLMPLRDDDVTCQLKSRLVQVWFGS